MNGLTVMSGSANRALATRIAAALGVPLTPCTLERFPDGELQVELLEDCRDKDVYLVQPTRPPAGEHLLELMLLSDACRRAGARRVTAVLPYVGYARQDRRSSGGEPVGARVVADILCSGAIDRLVAMDLHSRAVEGYFRIPVEHVTARELLCEKLAFQGGASEAVVVSPDLGAVKLAESFAKRLGLKVAVVLKERLSGSEVSAHGVMGEVRGRSAIVVDDLVSTGGTIAQACESVLAAGCTADITVVATHALLVGPAAERLRALPIRQFIATDSVAPPADHGLPLVSVSVAPLIAAAIRRLAGA